MACRNPRDLVTVIDLGASMAGEKLKMMKHSNGVVLEGKKEEKAHHKVKIEACCTLSPSSGKIDGGGDETRQGTTGSSTSEAVRFLFGDPLLSHFFFGRRR